MTTLARLGFVIDSAGAKAGAAQGVAAIDSLGNAAKRAQSSLAEAAKWLGLAGLGVGAAEAVRSAQDFEKQMALVATIADEATFSTRVFGEQLRNLFRSSPVSSISDLTAGLQNIIGAGIPAGQAMEVLATATRAATANNATAAQSVKALTSVMNAYAAQGLKAGDVSDALFAAIDVGDVSMAEFAETLGRITPIASSMNVPLQDVLASISALTVGGINANEAVTGIRSAMVNIIKPTGDFAKKFPELAREFNATKLQADGFVKFLSDFERATGGASEATTSLFTDVQGLTAVNALLSDGGARVTAMLGEVRNAAGATDKAFETMMQTSSATNQMLRNQLSDVLLDLGQRSLPAVNAVMAGFISVLAWVRDNGPLVAGAIAAAAAALAAYHGAARVAAVWTSILGAARSISAFLSLAKSIRSAADAMALLQIVGGGAAKAALAVIAIAAGYAAYKTATDAMASSTAKFNAELERIRENEAKLAEERAQQGFTTPVVELPTAPTSAVGTVDADAVNKARELNAANRERIILAKQAYDLAQLQGEAAERLRIEQDAENEVRRVSAELSGAQLAAAVRSIEVAKQWNVAALEGNRIAERRTALLQSRERIGDMEAETVAMRAQIAALSTSRAAYEQLVSIQRADAAVLAERNRLKAEGLTLSAEDEARIRTAIADNERLQRVLAAMRDVDGNPFSIPDDAIERVGRVAEGIAQAVSAAQGLVSAFGELGRTIGGVLGQTGQLLTNLSRAQRAGIFTDKEGKQQDVGFGGALSGAAGVAGVASAASAALGVVGAVVAIGDALDIFGTRARERARQLAEAAVAFNIALEDFAIESATAIESALQENMRRARDVATKALAAAGGTGSLPQFNSADDILRFADQFTKLLGTIPNVKADDALFAFAAQLREVGARAQENERILREQNAAALARETANANVQLLRSRGLDAQADAAQRELDLNAAITEAREKYGADADAYIAILREIAANEAALADERRAAQEAAESARQAEALLRTQREAAAFEANLSAREASLAGNNRDAFIIARQAEADAELNAARDLLTAGTITAEAFARLQAVLTGELAEAIADYDAALEEEARRKADAAAQEAAQAEARARQQNADITRQMIAAYEVLNPAMAEQLRREVEAAERAQQLADAENDVVRARLEELFALQDQAAATKALADAMDRAARAAADLADFQRGVTDEYLRATGRGFDADRLALEEWLREQLRKAAELGADAETIRKINATYDARLNKLIADTIEASDPTARAGSGAPGAGGGDPTTDFITRGVQRAVSGAEALQMLDVQLQQLATLRIIATNTAAMASGGRSAAVSAPAATVTPLTADLDDATTERVETALGRRLSLERRLNGVSVL